MNIENIIEWLTIGIITGAFSTFAPVVISKGADTIFSLINKAG